MALDEVGDFVNVRAMGADRNGQEPCIGPAE